MSSGVAIRRLGNGAHGAVAGPNSSQSRSPGSPTARGVSALIRTLPEPLFEDVTRLAGDAIALIAEAGVVDAIVMASRRVEATASSQQTSTTSIGYAPTFGASGS